MPGLGQINITTSNKETKSIMERMCSCAQLQASLFICGTASTADVIRLQPARVAVSKTDRMAVKSVKCWELLPVVVKLVCPTSLLLNNLYCAISGALLAGFGVSLQG